MASRLMILIVVAVTPVSAKAMCPFCPPASPTLSEQVANADGVALASLVRVEKRSENDAISEVKVVSLLKDLRDQLNEKQIIKIPVGLVGEAGDLFLLTGAAEIPDSDKLTFDIPQPISEIGFQYLKQAPAPETERFKRLKYFLRFLEYPDMMLADDAYYEFAGAEYSDLVLIRESLPREKIRRWLTDPNTLAPRTGLYGLMLGLCGNDTDKQLLEKIILDDADKTRLGVDGVMGGYLLLTGEKGMDLIVKMKIENSNAPIADVHAAMAAFRFLWEYGEGVVPKSRLKAAVRKLLDRTDVVDMAIADLARWNDWSVQDRMMKIYQTGDPENPLGQIRIRQAVIRYMIASTLDQPEKKPTPAHVTRGHTHLEALRQLDPRGVARAERLMVPRDSKPE